MRVRRRSVWMLVTVVAAVACVLPGSMAADEATSPETSRIEGKITSGSKKAPVADATVLAYHLATGTIFRSQPTAENGRFEFSGLPHGYFDMAVEAPDGLYVANQVVNVPPDGRAVSNFNLRPGGAGSESRDFPGSDQAASGIATFAGKSFSRKPKGIAIWTGSSVAVVALALILSNDSDSNDPVSPSTP